MNIRAQQIIDGRFRIIEPGFKSGALGIIHTAENAQGRKLALKFPLEGNASKNHPDNFKKEYRNLLKFTHPNVARAFHFGEHEGQFFIAFEFIDGRELREATLPLSPAEMIPLFLQALEGLEAIHREQMLHFDIKSGNILVSEKGRVYIIDLGFAAAVRDLVGKKICGTPFYMAPEVVLQKACDNRADLFSFGVAMYYCLTGVQPFKKRSAAAKDVKILQEIVAAEEEIPPPPSLFNVNAPKWLDDVVLTLMARNPEDRFPTARAVINALKTRHPEDYKGSPEAMASYLLPRGNLHVGREREKEIVFKALEELLANRQPANAFCWITGEPGTGKTHFLKAVKERGEMEAGKVALSYLEFPSSGQQREAESGEEWLRQWVRLLEMKMAENKQPLLVLIDNAGEESLRDILHSLRKAIAEKIHHPELHSGACPILVCCGAETAPREKDDVTLLKLRPFERHEIEQYLRSTPALAQKEIPEEWVSSLYNQTAGNPRELKERLLAIDSKGLLFDINGNIIAAQIEEDSVDFIEKDAIPSSTQERLESEWKKLSAAERNVLEAVAAWCWKDFVVSISLSGLQTLTGEKEHLLVPLNRLVAAGMMTHDRRDDTYSFRKGSYLPVLVYHKMDPERRRRWHRQAAKQNIPRNAVLLHRGYGLAKEEAIRALLRLAQDQLAREGQAALAKQLLDRALQEAPPENLKLQAFLRSRWIEALCYCARYEEAISAHEEILAKIRSRDHFPATLSGKLAVAILPAFIEKQDFRRAEKEIGETLVCLARKGAEQSPIVLILKNFLAKIAYKKYFSEAGGGKMEFLEAARRGYEENAARENFLHRHQQDLVRNNDLGLVLQTLGDNRRAIEVLEGKRLKLRRNSNIFIEFVTITTLAEACRILKRYPQAEKCAAKAMNMARKTGQGKWILYAHYIKAGIDHAIGLACLLKKKKRMAEEHFQKAMKEHDCCLAASIGLQDRRESETRALDILVRKAQCYEDMGNWEAALAHFKAALDYQSPGVFLPFIYAGLGEVYGRRNEIAKAREFLEKAKPLLKELPRYITTPYLFKIMKAEATLYLRERMGKRAAECVQKMRVLALRDEELRMEYGIFCEEIRKWDSSLRSE